MVYERPPTFPLQYLGASSLRERRGRQHPRPSRCGSNDELKTSSLAELGGDRHCSDCRCGRRIRLPSVRWSDTSQDRNFRGSAKPMIAVPTAGARWTILQRLARLSQSFDELGRNSASGRASIRHGQPQVGCYRVGLGCRGERFASVAALPSVSTTNCRQPQGFNGGGCPGRGHLRGSGCGASSRYSVRGEGPPGVLGVIIRRLSAGRRIRLHGGGNEVCVHAVQNHRRVETSGRQSGSLLTA